MHLADHLGDVLRVEPPRDDHAPEGFGRGHDLERKGLPGASQPSLDEGVEEKGVDAISLERGRRSPASDPKGLDDRDSEMAAVLRGLGSVQLDRPETTTVYHPLDLCDRMIGKNTHRTDERRKIVDNLARCIGIDIPWGARHENEAEGVGPGRIEARHLLTMADAALADHHDLLRDLSEQGKRRLERDLEGLQVPVVYPHDRDLGAQRRL